VDAGSVLRVWQAGTGRELRRSWAHTSGGDLEAGTLTWPAGGLLLGLAFPRRYRGAVVTAVVGAGEFDPADHWDRARLWNLNTRKRVRSFGKPDTPVHDCVLSPDGRFLAGLPGARICCWSVATGKEVLAVPWATDERGALAALAFSPDGRTL